MIRRRTFGERVADSFAFIGVCGLVGTLLLVLAAVAAIPYVLAGGALGKLFGLW